MARYRCRGEIHAGQLADSLATALSVSRLFARQILRAATDTVVSHLLAGRAVTLRGFGRFHLKAVAAKRLRCGSHNRRVVVVEAHAAPAWRACDTLRAAVRAVTAQVNHGGHGERRGGANSKQPHPTPRHPERAVPEVRGPLAPEAPSRARSVSTSRRACRKRGGA